MTRTAEESAIWIKADYGAQGPPLLCCPPTPGGPGIATASWRLGLAPAGFPIAVQQGRCREPE